MRVKRVERVQRVEHMKHVSEHVKHVSEHVKHVSEHVTHVSEHVKHVTCGKMKQCPLRRTCRRSGERIAASRALAIRRRARLASPTDRSGEDDVPVASLTSICGRANARGAIGHMSM